MADINAQIQDLIRQHLPEEVGATLRQRLADAEVDAQAVKHMEDDLRLLRQSVYDLREQLSDIEAREKELAAKADVMTDREKVVAVRELRMEMVEQKAQFAERRVADMKEVVGMVFANNRFKYSTAKTAPVVRESGIPGQMPYIEHHTTTTTGEGEQ